MVQHALKAASPADEEVSDLVWATVSARVLANGDRRLEASTYLTDGYGLRQALEAASSSARISDLAQVWQPSRLKGFQVDNGKGLPFLSAGQVFEAKPRVRKWLAEAMVPDADDRQLQSEWLLMSCSGEVGRITAVYDEHLGKVITHDLLRIVLKDETEYGWLYAYMKTPTFFAIARSSQYGHMIKHLEPEHVLRMPVAMPDDATRRRIGQDARNALEMRQASRRLQQRADDAYAALLNPTRVKITNEPYTTIRASSVFSGRRRIEGQFHKSDVQQVSRLVEGAGHRHQRLAEVVTSVSMSQRFKRHFGDSGTPYRSASELFDVNPRVTKRIYAGLLSDPDRYMLQPGEIIMARSGQTYGLLGRTMVLTKNHAGTFGSEDLIRIVPDESLARTGYLQTALNHADYGRPLVIRYASGTSVPHLDPVDIREVPIPRFSKAEEDMIADLSDEATALAAKADRLESAAVEAAEQTVAALTGRHGALALVHSSDD